MHRALLLTLFVAQAAAAADGCFNANSHASVVLRGVIENRPDQDQQSFTTWLNLSSPICVDGIAPHGVRYKKEVLSSIQLGIPRPLFRDWRSGGRLAPGKPVTLRGQISGPALNAKNETIGEIIFGIEEIL